MKFVANKVPVDTDEEASRVLVVTFVKLLLGMVEVVANKFAVDTDVMATSVPLKLTLPLVTTTLPFVIFKAPDKLSVPELKLVLTKFEIVERGA